MRKAEIKVGGVYVAKVSGKLTKVRVDAIEERERNFHTTISYNVTNLTTDRKTTFRSAAKFRSEVKTGPATVLRNQKYYGEEKDPNQPSTPPMEESCSDPTLQSPQPSTTNRCPTCEGFGTLRNPSRKCPDCNGGQYGSKAEREQCSDPTTPTTATSPLSRVLRASISQVQTDKAPHLIVEARAGTGKTTTLVEGLKILRGEGSKITPSPQQQAVWDSIALSRGVKTVCFVAFNKSIATELQQRVPAGCDAMTMHSMGFRAVMKQFGQLEPNQYVVQDIIAELLGKEIGELRRTKPVVLKATEDLVSLCKMNLVGNCKTCDGFGVARYPQADTTPYETKKCPDCSTTLAQLANHYEVDLNDSRNEVFALVPRVLERCKDPTKQGKITYDDMIWLPVILGLPVFQYDLLLVDEAQDLNRCQQALAKRAGKRLVLCGDPKQAIYGFAGADAESMPRMGCELGETERGCVTLPLTVTRRCGRAIVAEANQIVPDFSAHESNPDGKVSQARYPTQGGGKDQRGEAREVVELPYEQTYMPLVQPGDMVLCRCNGPLVSQCFRFLKRGIKATIHGRDVGKGLVTTVKKSKATTVVELCRWLGEWRQREEEKERAKRNPDEGKLISLVDRYDCLICFTEDANTVEDVIRKIESVFTDNKMVPGIRLSSVHRAKGLESKKVFFLMPEGGECPHPMAKSAWQQEQERNLLYVGITRAVEELTYVT